MFEAQKALQAVPAAQGATVAACDSHKFFDPKAPRPQTGKCSVRFGDKEFSL
jgi:hypothetical protein